VTDPLRIVTEPRLSGDRKVSPSIRKKGKTLNGGTVRVKNSFGLPAIKSCAGATDWCKDICYALALQKGFPNVKNLVDQNWDAIEPYLNDSDTLTILLHGLVSQVKVQLIKDEVPADDWVFRHFWDGDIPSASFATAIRRVAVSFPDIQFWLYTRTFNVTHRLTGLSNLMVYLSVDKDNVASAIKTELAHGEKVMLAFCADTWDQTEQIAAKFPHRRKGPKCPELTGKIPLVVWDGKQGKGACVECGMCIYGRNNVRFASSR